MIKRSLLPLLVLSLYTSILLAQNNISFPLDKIIAETCFTTDELLLLEQPEYTDKTPGSLGVYTNTATSILYLEMNDLISTQMVTATVLSKLGVSMVSKELPKARKADMDISELKGGQSYLVIVETADGSTFIEKFKKV